MSRKRIGASFASTDPPSHSSENTWFTPYSFIEKLGEFETDPCTVSFRPFDIAKNNIEFDCGQDGLLLNWKASGRMFINPPYGKDITSFIDKFITEKPYGVMLIFSRMGTEGVQRMIKNGAHCLLLRKRVRFIRKDGSIGGSAGTDSMLVFWNASEIENLKVDGVVVKISNIKACDD